MAATGTLTLEGLTLRGGSQSSSGFPGGGLFNRGTLALAETTVSGNLANFGGGLRNEGGTVSIARAMFVENGVLIGVGGGVSNSSGTMTITETTFARNGGDSGAALGNGGTVLLTNSTLVDNIAFGFGGFFNGGTAILINTTIARSGTSGALINGGRVFLTNTTLADNPDGGLVNGSVAGPGGTVILTNTILAHNRGGRCDCVGPVISLGNNLIGDPTGCTIILQPTDLTGDPGLGDFTDNGAPGNGHFPLLPGSPAIDAGNDAFCPPTDQLGQPRVGRCDIGAIEFQGKHHKQD